MTANHPEDLVARPLGERLREYLKLKYMGNCKCGNCQLVPVEVVAEAADAITSLVGERDALRLEVGNIRAVYENLEASEILNGYKTRAAADI